MSAPRLATRIGRGVLVDTALGLILRGSSLAVTVAVARTLTQAEFGAVTIALSIYGIGEQLTNLSLETALARRPELPAKVVDVAWSISVVRAILLAATLYAIAPTLARLWGGETAVSDYLRVLALGTVASGFANRHIVRYQRELRFGLYVLIGNIPALLGSLVSLALLLVSGDAFALIIGPVVGAFLYSILTWALVSPRPKPSWSPDIASELFGFGRWLLAHSIFVYLIFTLDNLYVGKVLGLAALGAYGLGWRVTNTLVTFLTRSLSGMLVPTYASMQSDQRRMNQTVLKALGVAACAGALVASEVFVFASELFAVLAGSADWAAAIPVARALTAFAFARVINNVIGPMFHAVGKPRTLALLSGFHLLMIGPALYFGSKLAGTTGVAAGLSVTTLIVTAMTMTAAHRAFQLSLRMQLSAAAFPVLISVPVALAAWAMKAQLENVWVRLLGGSAGLVVLFLATWEGFRKIAPRAWGAFPPLVAPVLLAAASRIRRVRAVVQGST